jgi:hypothetical protein
LYVEDRIIEENVCKDWFDVCSNNEPQTIQNKLLLSESGCIPILDNCHWWNHACTFARYILDSERFTIGDLITAATRFGTDIPDVNETGLRNI